MSNTLFSVDQLLQDPLTRLVMQADDIDEREVRRILEDAARAIILNRRTERWISVGRNDLAGPVQ